MKKTNEQKLPSASEVKAVKVVLAEP